MSKYTLGLVSISFRGVPVEEILLSMKQAGLSCVEWGSDVHAPKDDADRLAQIAALQQKYAIACCSYGTYFRLGDTPLEELEGYIAAAKVLGTNVLRLWCGTKNSGEYSTQEKENLFAVCKRAAAMAAENEVILCMECHNGTFTDAPDAAQELMCAVDSNHFQMYWQPNQLKTVEENRRYAACVAPHTKHVHVFNWEGNNRYPLAQGVQQWQEYLSCFEGDRCLLLEFMPDVNIESLNNEADALRKVVDGL